MSRSGYATEQELEREFAHDFAVSQLTREGKIAGGNQPRTLQEERLLSDLKNFKWNANSNK